MRVVKCIFATKEEFCYLSYCGKIKCDGLKDKSKCPLWRKVK